MRSPRGHPGWLLALGLMCAAARLSHRRATELHGELAHAREGWGAERAAVMAAIQRLAARARSIGSEGVPGRHSEPTTPSDYEILEPLRPDGTGGVFGPGAARGELLAERAQPERHRRGDCDPRLPGGCEDVDRDVSWIERGRGYGDRLPGDFVSAPSLRFGSSLRSRRLVVSKRRRPSSGLSRRPRH